MSDKNSHSPSSINTLIGPGMRVEGEVSCPGVLRVQGDIQGNVSCDGPDGALVVDAEGNLTGIVHATRITVKGRLSGPLQSSRSIEIFKGGFVAGDVLFNELAIHAGGIVQGTLKPTHAADGDQPAVAPVAGRQAILRDGGKPRARRGPVVVLASVSIVAAIAGAWIWRDAWLVNHPADGAALKAEPAINDARPPERPREAQKVVLGDSVLQSDGSTEKAMASPPETHSETQQMKIQTVKGANPNRPAGVFLLVTNEPSVMYKKRREDPGEGDRITFSGGERVGVSIAPDEAIRVAKGTDITIFYQGQKVPRAFIASGGWIGFVAR